MYMTQKALRLHNYGFALWDSNKVDHKEILFKKLASTDLAGMLNAPEVAKVYAFLNEKLFEKIDQTQLNAKERAEGV